MPNETVSYVHVLPVDDNADADPSKKIFYVPGFVEGIVNKASTAAEAATRGYGFILPDQSRAMSRGAAAGRSMTELQAANYLSVYEHDGLADAGAEPPIVMARSYGGLVFNAMSRMARERGTNYFADSDVVLAASAGLDEDETMLRLAHGWIAMAGSESKAQQPHFDFPDHEGLTAKLSGQVMTSNLRRALGEAREMTRDVIDPELPLHVGRLTIMSYAQDKLFPAERLVPEWAADYTEDGSVPAAAYGDKKLIEQLMDNGAIWLTPVDERGGKHAVHDDEQYNPGRVIGAIQYATAA